MDKEAIYFKKSNRLHYWNRKNSKSRIDCRNLNCAKFTLFVTEQLYKVSQKLLIK